LDVATRDRHQHSYYPVQEYDGRAIPLSDSSVDLVFTSHVLEHIDSLTPFLAEIRRVMKPDAVAIHILPSATWRIWTSIAHYPFVLKTLLVGKPKDSLVNVASVRDAAHRHGVARAIGKTIVHPLVAHGRHSNAAAEVQAFRKRRWKAVFSQNGFVIVSAAPNGIFYTGYGVLPAMALAKRRAMAAAFGSAAHTFVLRKAEREPGLSDAGAGPTAD
jgi:SAM-dependent methyltransferase